MVLPEAGTGASALRMVCFRRAAWGRNISLPEFRLQTGHDRPGSMPLPAALAPFRNQYPKMLRWRRGRCITRAIFALPACTGSRAADGIAGSLLDQVPIQMPVNSTSSVRSRWCHLDRWRCVYKHRAIRSGQRFRRSGVGYAVHRVRRKQVNVASVYGVAIHAAMVHAYLHAPPSQSFGGFTAVRRTPVVAGSILG